MRRARWSIVWIGCLLLPGCRLDIAFDTNRGNLLAQAELTELINDIARTSVSSEPGAVSRVEDMGLSFALTSTRLSCVPDSTGNARRNSLGVPVDLTYAWTAARCASNVRSTERTHTGATRIEDLGGRFAVRVTHGNLVGTMTSPGFRERYSVNGVVEYHALSATTAAVVQRLTDRTETLSEATSGIVTKTRDLTLSLVDTLGVPTIGSRSGRRANLFSIKGTYVSVVEGALRDSTHLDITTVVPLQYDRTCSSGYRAGEVRAVVSGVAKDLITMTFNCQ